MYKRQVLKKEIPEIDQINEEIIEVKKESNGEFEMLESFKRNVINSNLCYDYEDLINLHICAKSSPLTILAGM